MCPALKLKFRKSSLVEEDCMTSYMLTGQRTNGIAHKQTTSDNFPLVLYVLDSQI